MTLAIASRQMPFSFSHRSPLTPLFPSPCPSDRFAPQPAHHRHSRAGGNSWTQDTPTHTVILSSPTIILSPHTVILSAAKNLHRRETSGHTSKAHTSLRHSRTARPVSRYGGRNPRATGHDHPLRHSRAGGNPRARAQREALYIHRSSRCRDTSCCA